MTANILNFSVKECEKPSSEKTHSDGTVKINAFPGSLTVQKS